MATVAESSAFCTSCMVTVHAGWIPIIRTNHITAIRTLTSITLAECRFAVGTARNTVAADRVFLYVALPFTIKAEVRTATVA